MIGALAFDVGRPRLEPRDVLLVQLELGRVLDRDDALALGDEGRQHVQQRRLAGAGAAADQHVQPRADAVLEELEHRPRHRPDGHQVFGLQPLGRKTANRQQRAVDRQRRDDRVHAGAVRQPRVDHRRAVVHAAADAADDAVDDAHQVLVVLERRRQPLELALALDVDVLVGVDQDVADRRVAQQRLERPETEDFVDDVGEERLALGHAERHALFGDQLEQQRPDFRFRSRAIRRRQRLEVQPVEQFPVYVRLHVEIPGRGASGRGRRRAWWHC